MTIPTTDRKEQKKRLLRAKIAVAIQDETGKALHYERKRQKEEGQLAIF
jgi:hypothetical protein